MNERMVMPIESAQAEAPVYEYADVVAIPRAEYNELINARLGIAMISSTIGHYGADDTVVIAVCKQFGYTPKKEDSDAE